MKKISLIVILLLMLKPAFAVEIYGSAWKTLTLKNNDGVTNIYAKNLQNQQILFYRADFIYNDEDSVIAEQYNGAFFAVFSCNQNHKVCSRFFDRKTGALSKIYDDVIGANGYNGKQIVANYDEKNNVVIVETIFSPCKKPTQYPLKIYPDSMFGDKTDFYPQGNLRIDYAAPITGDDATKIFHVDYAKVVARCKTGKG